ncbi:MAG: hypothetical protein WAO35_01940 [Terriglobia bacterium]
MCKSQNIYKLSKVLLLSLVVSVGQGMLWGQQGQTPVEPPSSPVYTRVIDILELTKPEAARGYPVRLHAVVTYYDDYEQAGVLFVQDSTGGIDIAKPSRELGLKAGDLVEVKGVTDRGTYRNVIAKSEVHALGRAPLPEPRRTRLDQLEIGRLDSQWVEIAGVVRTSKIDEQTKKLILGLGVESDNIKVVVRYPESARPNLLHSNVRIQGVCGGQFDAQLKFIGIVILVPDISFVHNLGTSPSAEESTPVDSIRELAGLSARH